MILMLKYYQPRFKNPLLSMQQSYQVCNNYTNNIIIIDLNSLNIIDPTLLQSNGGVKAYKTKTEGENSEKKLSFIEARNANSRLSDSPKLKTDEAATTTSKTIAEAAAAKEEEDSTIVFQLL